jgi:hypothetical protein
MSLNTDLGFSQTQLYQISPFICIPCLRRTLNLGYNLYNDFLMTNWFTQLYLVTLYSLVNCYKIHGYRFKWKSARVFVQLPLIPRVLTPALHRVWGADSTLWSHCSVDKSWTHMILAYVNTRDGVDGFVRRESLVSVGNLILTPRSSCPQPSYDRHWAISALLLSRNAQIIGEDFLGLMIWDRF